MFIYINKLRAFIVLVSGLLLTPAYSNGLIIEKTRIIFPSPQREVSLELMNSNSYPIIVQMWVDEGAPTADISKVKAPIVVLPPLIKLKANERRRIRLLQIAPDSAKESEQLLWFNAQEIPPEPAEGTQNSSLGISVTNRLKLFLRPKKLLAEGSNGWISQLQCHIKSQSANGASLSCRNPSLYYATVTGIYLKNSNNILSANPGMLAPNERRSFNLTPDPAAKDLDLKSGINLLVIGDDGYRQIISPQLSGKDY